MVRARCGVVGHALVRGGRKGADVFGHTQLALNLAVH